MDCASTRNPSKHIPFHRTIFEGLAPDGGLYLPVETYDLRALLDSCTAETSFAELSARVCTELLTDELHDAAAIAQSSFPFAPHLSELDESILLLELFHGPSCAFKDFGASFLAHSMEQILHDYKERAIILTATSGDTGSAVAHAFLERENIEVVILYPSGRVSPLQESQLTGFGKNITAIELDGTFDDCQAFVKRAFTDRTLCEELPLTSANSINLGRLIPQAFYYLFAAIQFDTSPFIFCVPSGNFGNLTAGILAQQWGMNASHFIAATNINDIVPQYLASGLFEPRTSMHTLSNAMDVGNPSNFERLLTLFHHNQHEMRDAITGIRVTDDQTRATMRKWWERKNILLDPHTATGVNAAERYREEQRAQHGKHENEKIVVLSTAHAGKFGEIVIEATGQTPPIPHRLQEMAKKPKQSIPLPADYAQLSQFLRTQFSHFRKKQQG